MEIIPCPTTAAPVGWIRKFAVSARRPQHRALIGSASFAYLIAQWQNPIAGDKIDKMSRVLTAGC